MIIKKEKKKKMLKDKGKQYTITMYINHKFDMTGKQLEFVLDYGDKHEKETKKATK